jgi:hypothetical protein
MLLSYPAVSAAQRPSFTCAREIAQAVRSCIVAAQKILRTEMLSTLVHHKSHSALRKVSIFPIPGVVAKMFAAEELSLIDAGQPALRFFPSLCWNPSPSFWHALCVAQCGSAFLCRRCSGYPAFWFFLQAAVQGQACGSFIPFLVAPPALSCPIEPNVPPAFLNPCRS